MFEITIAYNTLAPSRDTRAAYRVRLEATGAAETGGLNSCPPVIDGIARASGVFATVPAAISAALRYTGPATIYEITDALTGETTLSISGAHYNPSPRLGYRARTLGRRTEAGTYVAAE